MRFTELKSAGIIDGISSPNGKTASGYYQTQSGKETFDVIFAL